VLSAVLGLQSHGQLVNYHPDYCHSGQLSLRTTATRKSFI